VLGTEAESATGSGEVTAAAASASGTGEVVVLEIEPPVINAAINAVELFPPQPMPPRKVSGQVSVVAQPPEVKAFGYVVDVEEDELLMLLLA
jgi:hypothetical protein